MRVLWKWSLVVAAVVLIFFMWHCGSAFLEGQKLADAAMRHFHQQLNTEAYEEIYRESDEGFRAVQSHEQLIKFLQAVHRKLGSASDGRQVNMRVEVNTRGTFITAWYTTAFAGGAATETFTWTKGGGALKLYKYHIESNAFLTQ
jgi:hypothetical protein